MSDLDYLFAANPNQLPDFESLPFSSSSRAVQKAMELYAKTQKSASEKRYIEWVRHSQLFLEKKYSPLEVLRSWTGEVEKILRQSWEKHFSKEDQLSLAFMGKLGSGELNLSSDIDLICFGDYGYQKKIRSFLEDVSGAREIPKGFKVDFDLRPGGKSAPLITSANGLGNYLWKTSDPWERYAYTRMRCALGNNELAENLHSIRDQYCYRKYLSSDFFHNFVKLRKSYQDNLGSSKVHLKLGAGGIRDVELFVQTFQIVYGGKFSEFRDKATLELIELFIKSDIHTEIFSQLERAYIILRQAEGVHHAFNEQGGFYWKDQEDPELSVEVHRAMTTVNQVIESYKNSSSNLFGQKSSYTAQSVREKIKEEAQVRKLSPEKALKQFEDFFSDSNKKMKSYYPAILSQENMWNSFFDLLHYSPFGCQVLSRRPSLFDVFLIRKFDIQNLKEEERLQHLADLKMLDHIIAANNFSKNRNLESLSRRLIRSYEFILNSLISEDSKIDLLFLGKMASSEVGLESDLDFVLLTFDEHKESLREAKRLYKKISYPSLYGPLVPFDKDAGPMGAASPTLMNINNLENFLKERAEPWRKLMYFKHRFLRAEKNLKYLDCPFSEAEFDELYSILKKRLEASDLSLDQVKLQKGGLFHTEFLINCMWAYKGKQAPHEASVSQSLKELSAHYPSEKYLEQIASHYDQLRALREISFIEKSQSYQTKIHQLLDQNFKLLNNISNIVFKRKIK